MAYAEKRGNLWRARWRTGRNPRVEAGFRTRKDAENFGRDQEAAIRSNTYVDPRAGRITLTEWVNRWYPALDLELNTRGRKPYRPPSGTGPTTPMALRAVARGNCRRDRHRWRAPPCARGTSTPVAAMPWTAIQTDTKRP